MKTTESKIMDILFDETKKSFDLFHKAFDRVVLEYLGTLKFKGEITKQKLARRKIELYTKDEDFGFSYWLAKNGKRVSKKVSLINDEIIITEL